MEDRGARPSGLCDLECRSEGRIRGRGKEAGVAGGVSHIPGRERKAAGKTPASEVYQREVSFLLSVEGWRA